MPRDEGTAIHRVFCASSQLASAPASYFSPPATAVVAIGPPRSAVPSKRNSFPPPATAIASFSFHGKTSGEDVKFAPATVANAFGFSVVDSSAITWFAGGDEPPRV